MDNVLDELQDKETFTIIPKADVPHNSQVVPCKWVLKCERKPNGVVTKYKAILCWRDDQEVLEEGEVVFAPNVDWPTD